MTDQNQDSIYNQPKKDQTWIIVLVFTAIITSVIFGFYFFIKPRAQELKSWFLEISINTEALTNIDTKEIMEINALIAEQKFDEALVKIEEIEDTNSQLELLASIASWQSENGYYEAALETTKKMVEIDPEDYYNQNYLGWAYMNVEDNQMAKKHLLKSIELNGEYRLSHNNLCIIYNDLGENNLAEQMCLRAIEIDPTNPKAYNNIAMLYEGMDRIDLSVKYLTEAVKLEPFDAPSFYNLGRMMVYYNTYRDIDTAEAHLKRSIEIDPTYGPTYSDLGYLFSTYYNDVKTANNYYLQAIEYGDNRWIIFYNVGINYGILGDYSNAVKYLSYADNINPNHEQIQYYLNYYGGELK